MTAQQFTVKSISNSETHSKFFFVIFWYFAIPTFNFLPTISPKLTDPDLRWQRNAPQDTTNNGFRLPEVNYVSETMPWTPNT